ncbi:MAG: EamA family transporter, partial [Candidatus Eremiobacteraeota bacterium]|nr:EamA family transporter [Candidatus Eremiobacteraeota bacterium]
WTWCRVRRVALPDAAEWRGAALTGFMLLVASNGVFSWTLRFIPAGVGALFFALAPLWMAVFGFLLYRERLAPLAALGLTIGLGGMVFLYSPSGAQHLPLVPTVLGVVCSLAWAFGSMIQRKLARSDVVQMSAMQMLVAALVLALLGLFSGERFAVAEFTPAALAALLYLIVFGSIVGFSAFLWLMNNVPTTLASTYSYVNPVVSIVLSVALLHERFTWQLGAGAGVIIFGVAVMMLAPRPRASVAEARLERRQVVR